MAIDVREHLADYEKSAAILASFIRQEVASARADEELSGYALEAYEMTLTRFHGASLRAIFQHSQSPIETIFLVSLLFSFVRGEPCGIIVGAPQPDFPAFVQQYQAYYRAMNEAVVGISEASEGSRSLQDYIDHLRTSGLMTAEEAAFHSANFLIEHRLGYAHAFHVSMQAGFPTIRVGTRGIRADLAIWVPSTPACRVVVECDGFAFHSAKEKFVTDRKRDRQLQAAGYQTFRFSGSEIWHDPAAAGRELFEYLESLPRSGT